MWAPRPLWQNTPPPMSSQVQAHAARVSYPPESCPFESVIVDVTHRCNMACRNCYIPNRTVPDLDVEWLAGILARLRPGTFVRLVGAEPTMRTDLSRLIRDVRRNRHHPVLLTNGLKLAGREYVRELKQAGLQVAYLSLNGGFDDGLYHAIDGMRCADAKLAALENLCDANLYVSLGMILVRGVNEHEPRGVLSYARRRRQVREYHLRSIGHIGRYMDHRAFTLREMIGIFAENAGVPASSLLLHERTPRSLDFCHGTRLRVQITEWPDLGSTTRGRLTPEGRIEPFFEHVLANEGGY